MGSGVSGGEDGARYGPSLMPGGASEAWYGYLAFSMCKLSVHNLSELLIFW